MLGGSSAREYVLKIIADVKDAVKGVDDVSSKTSSMKDKMMGVGKAVATGLATAAVVKFGNDCLDAAADADDAMDAVDSAFGNASKTVEAFSKDTAEKMGLSSQDYQTMAAETGRILTGFGIDNQTAADSTNTLATRAADLAAIVGGSTEDAMGAIDKAMQGQTKGLKQYGISISNAEVEARAMAKGYVDASGKVTDAGKAIATQELILDKTNKYQGEFAKNSGDLGSQQDIMRAKMENLQATIGTALIPVMSKLFEIIQPMIDFISNNISWIAPLVAGILAIVAAVKIWNIVQMILNTTLLANPIFLVVAAIAALVAGLIWAYNNVGWFKDAVDAMAHAVVDSFNWIKDVISGAFNWIKDNWPLLLAILTGPFGLAVLAISKNWDSIKAFASSARDAIANALSTVANIIAYPFKEGARIATEAWGGLIRLIQGAWNAINNALHGLADVITYPFRVAIDSIKWLWNSTIGRFSFEVPSWVPGLAGKGWSMPKMAKGGIVTRPTVALIGEAGPEAVIPLGRNGGGIGAGVVINVYALAASAEVGRQVYEALQEYNRTTGKVA